MTKENHAIAALNHMTPRILRLKDAPKYLGMDKNTFNTLVRPHIAQISIGQRGIGFDVLDLNAWIDQHKRRSETPLTALKPQRSSTWQNSKRPVSTNVTGSGKLIKKSSDNDFVKALERLL